MSVVFALFAIILYAYFWINGLTKYALWRKGNIRADGIINPKSKECEFYRIYIGDPENFMETKIPIAIENPKGEKIALSDIIPERIQNMEYINQDTSYSTITGYSGQSWPPGTTFINISRPDQDPNIKLLYHTYSFAIIDGNVVGVIIFSEGCYGLWGKNATKKYNFPLSESQIEEIFGEPDEIKVWIPWIEY